MFCREGTGPGGSALRMLFATSQELSFASHVAPVRRARSARWDATEATTILPNMTNASKLIPAADSTSEDLAWAVKSADEREVQPIGPEPRVSQFGPRLLSEAPSDVPTPIAPRDLMTILPA